MKNLIKFLLVLFPFALLGQTQIENYIKTITYKIPVTAKITAPTIFQALQNITYFDGLGRPIQKIVNAQLPLGKDVIVPVEYDDFGRQRKEYLRYTSSQSNMARIDNNVVIPALTSQYQTFFNDGNPYSEKELEASPLNRVIKQAAPGTAWAIGSGHEVKMVYQTNGADEVKLFAANTSWDAIQKLYSISLKDNGYYSANELYKNILYDENTAAVPSKSNGSTIEFKKF